MSVWFCFAVDVMYLRWSEDVPLGQANNATKLSDRIHPSFFF
jgi:hypothetical protein